MKLQMGLYKDGILIEPILNQIPDNIANRIVMNAMAGLLDRSYQEKKTEDNDNTYIAFDYKGGK